MEEMSKRIRKLRLDSGLSQAQLATYLGVDQSMIAKVEKDERRLSTDQIDKLSALFGCEGDFLTGETDDYSPLVFAFRAKEANADVLNSVALVNKIALNLRMLNRLLGDADEK